MKRLLFLLMMVPAVAGAQVKYSSGGGLATSAGEFSTPVNAAAATGTLAYTGTNVAVVTTATLVSTYTDANLPAANDTVLINDSDAMTYTFVVAVAVAGDVKLGTADECAERLSQAINFTGGTNAVGGDYLATRANPMVSVVFSNVGAGTGTLTYTSKMTGAVGNSTTIDGTWAGTAFFPDASLAGGLDPEQVMVGANTYTFVAAVASNWQVKKGTDADDSATNLNNAINMAAAVGVGDNIATGKYMAPSAAVATGVLDLGANTIVLTHNTKGAAGNITVLTAAYPQYSVTDAFSATPTGVDATLCTIGEIRFDTGFIYLCTATNTVADTTWKRATLAAF